MNAEQARELVLRKHNMNEGFTETEVNPLIAWIRKTKNPTTTEEHVFEQIESMFPDIWHKAVGVVKPKPRQPELFRISNALLVKLCSLVVHYEEWTSNTGHSLDKAAIDALMNDEEIVVLFKQMKELGLLPVKR